MSLCTRLTRRPRKLCGPNKTIDECLYETNERLQEEYVTHQTTSNTAEGISPHMFEETITLSIAMTITMRATSRDRHKMKHKLWCELSAHVSCCDISNTAGSRNTRWMLQECVEITSKLMHSQWDRRERSPNTDGIGGSAPCAQQTQSTAWKRRPSQRLRSPVQSRVGEETYSRVSEAQVGENHTLIGGWDASRSTS